MVREITSTQKEIDNTKTTPNKINKTQKLNPGEEHENLKTQKIKKKYLNVCNRKKERKM